MNKNEIQAKYLARHNALGTLKDAKDKDEFHREHRAIWHEYDVELQQRKVELEYKEKLTKAQKAELLELEALFPKT